jgi:hypothetical protein
MEYEAPHAALLAAHVTPQLTLSPPPEPALLFVMTFAPLSDRPPGCRMFKQPPEAPTWATLLLHTMSARLMFMPLSTSAPPPPVDAELRSKLQFVNAAVAHAALATGRSYTASTAPPCVVRSSASAGHRNSQCNSLAGGTAARPGATAARAAAQQRCTSTGAPGSRRSYPRRWRRSARGQLGRSRTAHRRRRWSTHQRTGRGWRWHWK